MRLNRKFTPNQIDILCQESQKETSGTKKGRQPAGRGRSQLNRLMGITLAVCLLTSFPAQAAKTPLISGTESDTDAGADGPALEDGTITENSADNTIASQAGSYTEEQLADSVIEYGELESLVRRGNGTAISADYSYQDSLAMYQEAYDAMISGARDMNYKADELEDAGGDETLIGTYERNAQTLSAAAKQYKRSITSLNSATNRASRNRTVWQIVKTAQTQWGTCRQLQDEVLSASKTAESYQAQADRKERELAAGLCTETDVLQAQKDLLSAQTALQSTTDQANKALRQLAILLGKSADSLTLGEVPAVSAAELSSMNLDADRAAAVIASSSVKSVRRSSATGDAARRLRHQQIEEAESAASASADEQYAEIAALSLERDAAQAAYQSAEKTYGALQIKYQSGAINKAAYLQGEASYLQKKAEFETAEISLRTAYDAYAWMLKGVS